MLEPRTTVLPVPQSAQGRNSFAHQFLHKPHLPGPSPSTFIGRNDHPAKLTVTGILETFGWETEDMGTAAAARAIEPLCMLWAYRGF